jgi:membrane protein YqaA with SNARE-associated domain
MNPSFFGIGTWLQGQLGNFGLLGQMLILFVVFFLDAVLFPMLPEAFVLYFYTIVPTVDFRLLSHRGDLIATAGLILTVVLIAELLANGFLYSLVKWKKHRIPHRLQHAMNKWREFLLFRDERVILLNRVVPIMPFMGAFAAISPWDPRKAFAYLVIGGAVKYGLLLLVVGVAGLVFDPSLGWQFTLGLILAIVALSLLSQAWLQRRLRAQKRDAAMAQAPLAPEELR